MTTIKSKINTIDLSGVEIYKLILEGKLKQFPLHFWDKPDSLAEAKEITIYLLETILGWNSEDIKENLIEKTFRANKLSGMLEYTLERSPYKAIDNAYPNKYKEWELKHTPRNFWSDETILHAIEWLVIKLDLKDVTELRQEHFINNDLKGMLSYIYKVRHKTMFYYIDMLYPNRYKPWHFAGIGNNYWTKETRELAVRWLIEDRLKIDVTDTITTHKITLDTFIDNKLFSIVDYFKGSLYLILKEYYPNLRWDIRKSKYEEYKQ